MVIGFDVSKGKVNWALVNKSGRVTKEGVCPNVEHDIYALLASVQTSHPLLMSAVESTGVYHLPVVRASEQLHCECRLLNPIQTKQFIAQSVRGTKTDVADARAIALLGLHGGGHVVRPVAESVATAKIYVRLARRLQVHAGALERMRQYMDLAGGDTSSLGVTTQHILESVATYQAAATDLLVLSTSFQYIQTIPGIGRKCALGIVSELHDDVSRFARADQLVAFAGLDPRVRQSGQMSASGRLTKRGSPHLRYWLYIAAGIARQHDPELRAAYERRRSAGKSHTVATVAVARKLTLRVYAVLRDQRPYEVH